MVVLKVHRRVQLETALDAGDNIGSGFKDVVHVVTTIQFTGVVNELFAAELLDFIQLCAFVFEFFGDGADKIINALVRSLGVQDDQALVLAIHLPVDFLVSFEIEY